MGQVRISYTFDLTCIRRLLLEDLYLNPSILLHNPLCPSIRTARVWKDWQLRHELKGHSQAVWAVLVFEPELYLTGLCPSLLLSASVSDR